MIQSSTRYLSLVGAALCFISLSPSARANHIDFLDAGPFDLLGDASDAPPPGRVISGISTASTLGGQRLISIEKLTGPASGLRARLNPVNPGANDDFMVFSAMAGSSGIFCDTVGAAAPLNANFLDIPGGGGAMWDRVRLTLEVGSSVSPNVTVTLTSSTAGIGAAGTASVMMTFAGGAGNLDFLLSAFRLNNPNFTDAAFRDIDSASFCLTGIDGGVYNIASFDRNGFVPIPEPSPYALLAVGLAGALVMARRRRAGNAA